MSSHCWRDRRDGVPLYLDTLFYWLQEAQSANIQYARVRRKLFRQLVSLVVTSRKLTSEKFDISDFFGLDAIDFTTIKSVLTCKQENLTDTKTLSFETIISDLITSVDDTYATIKDEKSRMNRRRLPSLSEKEEEDETRLNQGVYSDKEEDPKDKGSIQI